MTSFFKGTNRGLYGDNARKPPFSPVIVSSRFHRVRQALPIVSHRLFSSPCPTVTSEVASSSLVHPATKLLVTAHFWAVISFSGDALEPRRCTRGAHRADLTPLAG